MVNRIRLFVKNSYKRALTDAMLNEAQDHDDEISHFLYAKGYRYESVLAKMEQ